MTLATLPCRNSKPWSDEEDNHLVTMRAQGRSFSEIGRLLRRSCYACSSRHRLLDADHGCTFATEETGSAALHDSMLNLFDTIVDATGCSFRTAMTRCGMDGVPVL